MMLRILLLLVVLIVVPPLYLDRVYVRHAGRPVLRVLLYAPNFVMFIAAILLSAFESYSPRNAFVTNLFLTLFLGFIVTETVATFFIFLSRLFRRHHRVSQGFLALSVVAALGNLYVIIVGTTRGKYHVVEKQTTIEIPHLPKAFDGYRIVQLSDFHVGTYRKNPRFVDRVVEKTNRQRPDLIVFTGDMVNYNADEIEPFMSHLKRLRARDGVYSILGNHDYMPYYKFPTEEERQKNIRKLCRAERSLGLTLLLNQNKVIVRNGDSLAVIGTENDGLPPFPHRGDLKKAERGLPQSAESRSLTKILLSHDPSYWRRSVLGKTDIPLMLAGHTHGGQLRLFGFVPVSLLIDEWGGLYREGGQQLYVSTGLGEALLTFRFGIWPQIDVITLKRK